MLKTIKITAILCLFLSCSSLSKNMVKKGDLVLRGGIYENQQWQDNYVFHRTSWFKELTLTFDILLAPITEDLPWFVWLSRSNKERIKRCPDARILLTYSWNPNFFIGATTIPHQTAYQQFEEQGFEVFALTSFESHLRMHPNFEYLSLQLYKTVGICAGRKVDKIKINMPGFKETLL